MSAPRVRTDVSGGVATITLANVEARNAIDVPFAAEIGTHVRDAAERCDVGVLLVRADGPAWCVGGALDVFRESGDEIHDYITDIGRAFIPLVTTLHECRKITIAAVHGAVGGGGIGLMLAHDVVIAARGTVMALGYSRIGTNPDGGSSHFLARDVGYRRALEMYLLNERLDADRALELGMVNRVVEANVLQDEAAAYAGTIADGPWRAQGATKRLLRQALDGLLARQLDDEFRMFADHTREADFAEGVRSFLEKRPPRFGRQGRLMFDSVLVANRGEIAVRVVRTLNRLGIHSVAVYSDADADAPHARLADEAIRIGPATAAESYLSIERVIEAARATGAQAIHPGYGFLSENPAFARACAGADIVFVGPPPEAMERLGDKVSAKLLAEASGVPVLPGLQRPGLTDDEIGAFAEQDGRLPLMVKAAAGGGGRGMRIVRSLGELPAALAAARREALAGFGDDTLLVERYVERARHIEVQLLADAHGTVLHLGERECSLQRRHQKVVEESPSPVVSDELRERIGTAAVALAREAGYVGAGTAEFLMSASDASEFFFLEVNARLQVEHPVTEQVTGLDLVEQQLRIAAGEPLGIGQEDVALRGHSIEVRVCAEDPASGFLPATGRIVGYREPAGEGIRVDSGVALGSDVGASYDSLLLKLISTGHDREEALERLSRGLADLRILGVTTNAGYLARLVRAPDVRAGELDTGLLERGVAEPRPSEREALEAAIACAAAETLVLAPSADPWDALAGFRVTGTAPVEWELEPAQAKDIVTVAVLGDTVIVGGEQRRMAASDAGEGRVRVELDGRARLWDHATNGADRWVAAGPDAFAHRLVEPVVEGADAAAQGALEAPMPGTVLSVRAAAGATVDEGEVLLVMESMKMELTLTAPAAATVGEVYVIEGQSVRQGQALVELEEAA